KEYEIQPQRGIIEVRDGDKIVPIVLNEKRYTVFADPKYIKDPEQVAAKLVEVLGGDAASIQESLTDTQSRYKIIAKKLTKEQAEKIDGLELKGVGTREESYRTYPQGQLASQVLGFVNDEGKGQYGIEQFLD